ncbi:MAG: NAD(P)H-hydrate dehydratase [Ideonella sp.]|nr:NAD(P)H-hydrate dehydratase [Ideonella sp.]MCC7459473.1 NAD(P)H-hydrate dehydratase [Nitrospira sp.]
MSPPAAPQPILPSRRSWPLHDGLASRAAEGAAAAERPAHALMARAGEAVARLALAVAPHAHGIHVCCGPGNNGGDGFVAARWLQAWGKPAAVSFIGTAAQLPTDARWAVQAARDAGVAITEGVPDRIEADLAIDALLGLGVARDLGGAVAGAVDRLNASDAVRLAVDLPSGLDGDTGAVWGRAVRAAHTLSLLTLKPGLFTAQGRDHAGRVWFDDLGVLAEPTTLELAGPETARALSPLRCHAQHKGSFGDVVVLGGAPGMVGAAVLAARAASAAGAGRVYLGLLAPTDAGWHDTRHPELMARAPEQLLLPATLAGATVVCGCGGGNAVRHALPAVLHHAARLLLDADALNALAADETLRRLLRARAARAHATLLTPHPLEAARWLGGATRDVQADRVEAARALAEMAACTVLLKGSGTVIASPGAVTAINPTGDARLGSAGSGDVLAGWAGGLWAACADYADAHAVAQAAAWLHGAAVDHAPASGALRASALIEAIQRAREACVASV